MSNNNESILCLRCNSKMEPMQEVYAIPRGRSSNSDEVKVDLTKVINLQLIRCSNGACGSIEVKAPNHWPSLSPAQH